HAVDRAPRVGRRHLALVEQIDTRRPALSRDRPDQSGLSQPARAPAIVPGGAGTGEADQVFHTHLPRFAAPSLADSGRPVAVCAVGPVAAARVVSKRAAVAVADA